MAAAAKGTKNSVYFISTFKRVMERGDGAEMKRIERETRVCAEPERGITRKGERRSEKAQLSDEEK